jgi:hypothetical protein
MIRVISIIGSAKRDPAAARALGLEKDGRGASANEIVSQEWESRAPLWPLVGVGVVVVVVVADHCPGRGPSKTGSWQPTNVGAERHEWQQQQGQKQRDAIK